jgi:hypothetical protein
MTADTALAELRQHQYWVSACHSLEAEAICRVDLV